jgi:hypothetical protein
MDVMQTEDPTAIPANSPTCAHSSNNNKKKTASEMDVFTAKENGKLHAHGHMGTLELRVVVVAYCSRVRCDGECDEHHVEGHDDLDDQCVPVRPGRRGGAEHGDGVKHRLEHERRADRAGELRRPVERHLHMHEPLVSINHKAAIAVGIEEQHRVLEIE